VQCRCPQQRLFVCAHFVQSETVLLDLKHLLMEAKQRIPPVLATLEVPYLPKCRSLPVAALGSALPLLAALPSALPC
jgi:hypothetical protein